MMPVCFSCVPRVACLVAETALQRVTRSMQSFHQNATGYNHSLCLMEETKAASTAFCKWQPPTKYRAWGQARGWFPLCTLQHRWNEVDEANSLLFAIPNLKQQRQRWVYIWYKFMSLFTLRGIPYSKLQKVIHSKQPQGRMKYIERDYLAAVNLTVVYGTNIL